MRCQIQDVVIASRCAEANFSLTGKDVSESIHGVETFKYLWRPLDRLDGNWTEVLRNIRQAIQFWGWLGNFLGREGKDSLILSKVYDGVV